VACGWTAKLRRWTLTCVCTGRVQTSRFMSSVLRTRCVPAHASHYCIPALRMAFESSDAARICCLARAPARVAHSVACVSSVISTPCGGLCVSWTVLTQNELILAAVVDGMYDAIQALLRYALCIAASSLPAGARRHDLTTQHRLSLLSLSSSCVVQSARPGPTVSHGAHRAPVVGD
jgi:hypothetical protein